MSGSIPYLGSKISLISKSEIRYEGILYTIDAQESIIALAKVRSFGTEDRPSDMPVPAREEVYEYIIFRGTDIKKIEVCNPESGLPNDPAIVQHSAPTSFQPAPYSRQPLGPVGGNVNNLGLSYNNPYGQSMTQQGIPGSGGFPLGSSSQASELNNGASGGGGNNSVDVSSGSTQPPIGAPPARPQTDALVTSRSSTPSARKSPVSDIGVQVSPPSSSKDDKKKSPKPEKSREPKEPSASGRGRPNHQPQGGPKQYSQAVSYDRSGYHNYQSNYGGYQYRSRGRPQRRQSQPRRGNFNQGNRRQMQDRQLFEKEFDFEKANEDFEELMTKLSKAKISENGDTKKDDSGHETGSAGESTDATTTTTDEENTTFYDKTKSFFDTISCEAVERSKGKSQRPDWRHERKLNVETFGVGSTRRGYYPRGRGGYRGGGGGFYRNYQGYYNYNNYYRGGHNSNNYSRGGGGGGGGSGRGISNLLKSNEPFRISSPAK